MLQDSTIHSSKTVEVIDFVRGAFCGYEQLLDYVSSQATVIVFGGVPRDILQFSNREVRDIDLVVAGLDNESLSKIFDRTIYRKTRFGGLQCKLRKHFVDIWGLADTWAFKTGLVEKKIENLPRTVFLTTDAIAVNLDSGDVYENSFYENFERGTLDIVLEDNPFPSLCVLRAVVYRRKYGLTFTPSLKEYILRYFRDKKNAFEEIRRTQTLHYGKVVMSDARFLDELRSFVDHDIMSSHKQIFINAPSKSEYRRETIPIRIELDINRGAKIRVVGVGGGGGNAINSMIRRGLDGVDFVAVNTDLQALQGSQAPLKIQVGSKLTHGLGAGADPSVGCKAVEENREEITNSLAGSEMVFITAGMGGGTGTGGGPIVANIAKGVGALVVGIVTMPFHCEGKKRLAQADTGIAEMRKHVDTLIVVPNQKLLSIVEHNTPLQRAFDLANGVLFEAARGISELIINPGLVNVDFADVRTVMREMGDAVMGSGVAKGENRAAEAAHAAISSPLLDDVTIAGAQGLLVNITGGPTMSLVEFDEAAEIIREAAGEDANVILGAVVDENLDDEIMVTVIATGFNKRNGSSSPAAKASRNMRVIDKIPAGVDELKSLDEPAFQRRGIELNVASQGVPERERVRIDKSDPDKPAFLRKIMD